MAVVGRGRDINKAHHFLIVDIIFVVSCSVNCHSSNGSDLVVIFLCRGLEPENIKTRADY